MGNLGKPTHKGSIPIETNYHDRDGLSMEQFDLSECYSKFLSGRAPNDNGSQSSIDLSGKRLLEVIPSVEIF